MASPSILKCNICPRKPNFSDLSHLLTHVSSKGHLSHYFKLQVRSHQEPEASELLAAYDQWYADNNLANLLSDRMLAKEAKKGKDQGSSTTQRNPSRRTSSILPTQKENLPSFLDPRLSQPYKFDANDESVVVDTIMHGQDHHGYRWQPMAQHNPSFHPNLPMSNAWKTEPQSDSEDALSPLAQRNMKPPKIKQEVKLSTRRSRRPVTPDPFVDDASFEYEEYDNDNYQDSELRGTEEMTKLKGVLWPGMDIFDSATEQMRRKRNQKKDGTILKQMEKTSENVEPTELVFSPGGTLRKERPISGMVEDSSPLKGETPIPKKRVSRPRRPPLSQFNANAQMSDAQNRYKMRLRRQTRAVKLEEMSRQTLPFLDTSPLTRPSAMFGGRFDGIDDEYKVSFSGFGQARRGLNVYHDANESKGNLGNGNTHKPFYGPFNHSKPLSQIDMNKRPDIHQRGAIKGSNSRTLSMPEISRGKENIDPAYVQLGRNEPQGAGLGWDDQHNFAASSRYGSQYYHGFHGSYGSFADTDAFGYSYNPLSFTAPKGSQELHGKVSVPVENGELFTVAGHELTNNGPRAMSPDGTVSDIGQNDISHMYLDGLPE